MYLIDGVHLKTRKFQRSVSVVVGALGFDVVPCRCPCVELPLTVHSKREHSTPVQLKKTTPRNVFFGWVIITSLRVGDFN